MKRVLWVALVIVVIAFGGVGTWLALVKFEWEKPTIQIQPDSRYVTQKLALKVEDQKSGVAEVRLEIVQGGKSVTFLSEKYPKGTLKVEKTIALRPLPRELKDGEAQIKILAKDYSWNRGNPVQLERNVTIDTHPPQVSVLGALHYVNQGGAGVVTYQTNEEVPVSGLEMSDVFFPGYAVGKDRYVAYFALPYDAPAEVSLAVVAEDAAGNRGKAGLRPIVKAKKFRSDRIEITEGFLKNILPYFTALDPNLKGSPLEMYLYLNQKQREIDHRELKKLCRNTSPKPLWSGAFLRLPDAKPMASFAQARTYWYGGKQVDQQMHMGVDLASLAQSAVPAANSGKVVFAGPLGIYGNTVLLDHGCGLFSMYSHLSRIETEANKELKRGENVGRTGSTGMAGGDHLHFAMLVHGVFVNPIEWWDEHWIKDNIELKMKYLDPSVQAEQAKPAQELKPVKKAKKSARRGR